MTPSDAAVVRSAGHSPLVDNLARQHIVAPQKVDAVDLEPFAALRVDGLLRKHVLQVAALGGLPPASAKLRARIPGIVPQGDSRGSSSEYAAPAPARAAHGP